MEKNKNYITPAGLKKLQDEFSQLFQGERPKVVEVVTWAASNGDRSENADYQYGKKRLREIDKRLHFLKTKIENALVVDPTAVTAAHIVFGATVTISDEDGAESIWQIVGEDEFDIAAKKISWKSPLATALLGKKLREEILIQKPSGQQSVTIEKIEYK